MEKEEMIMPTASVLRPDTGIPGNGTVGSTPPSNQSRLKWIIIAVVGAVVLAVLVMLVLIFLEGKTAYGRNFQDKIWVHFVDTTGVEPMSAQFSIKYTDSGHFDFVPSKVALALDPAFPTDQAAEFDKYAFTLDGLVASGSANGYGNLTDSKNPKFDGTVTGEIKNNGADYSVTADGKMKDKTGFIKYDFNQALTDWADGEGFLDTTMKEQKGKWLKVIDPTQSDNLDQLSKTLSPQKDPNSSEHKVLEIWKKNRPFDIKSFKGVTIMNGKLVVHYSLQLNKPHIKTAFEDSFKAGMGNNQDQAAIDYFNKVTDIFLNKVQLSQYDVWIGVTDRKVYKSIIEMNAVSLTKTADMLYQSILTGKLNEAFGSAMGSAQGTSRDAKRLADIRQLSSALELYFNDNNGYPTAKDGQPVGLSGDYLGEIPQSPSPAEAPCTDYNNTYWYEAKGDAIKSTNTSVKDKVYSSYVYSFCLSADTGGVSAGAHTWTPQGIDAGAVTSTQPPAVVSPPTVSPTPLENDPIKILEDTVLDIYRSLPWDATIRIESLSKDFGKDKDVSLPTDFIDLNQNYNYQ